MRLSGLRSSILVRSCAALTDADGKVIGFELPMDPDHLQGLNRNRHLGRMLGSWMGRIVEEGEANKFNVTLIDTLKEIYDKDVAAGRKDEYVNVADKGNPDAVSRDAWNALGHQIKEDAAEVFGEKDFLPRGTIAKNRSLEHSRPLGLDFAICTPWLPQICSSG